MSVKKDITEMTYKLNVLKNKYVTRLDIKIPVQSSAYVLHFYFKLL